MAVTTSEVNSAPLAELSERARRILAGLRAEPVEVLELAGRLAAGGASGEARRLLAKAWASPAVQGQPPLRRRFGREYAAFTAADAELPSDGRLAQALEIVQECDDLANTRDAQTLVLAGQLLRGFWDLDGDPAHLELALGYFLRGHEVGVAASAGGCGLAAAQVLDRLAATERSQAHASAALLAQAAAREARAGELRREVLAGLSADRTADAAAAWQVDAARAEALFGLGEFAAAQPACAAVAAANPPPGVLGDLAQRLVDLALAQGGRLVAAEAAAALQRLCGAARAAALLEHPGVRLGVAFSGGGFRAALFHIGVLARLAEFDLLRRVEYLSCVSGGSIVGTHYTLLLRQLLQTKRDEELSAADYIGLVERLQVDFLAGVQTNLRAQVSADLKHNLRALFQPNVSWSHRLGELYEAALYSRVDDAHGAAPRYLDDLRIAPSGETAFEAARDNWGRRAKVPVLIINATSLNTGNCFRFTSNAMGEPPRYTDQAADARHRVPYVYYGTGAGSRLRLGHAVAASSCVPGFFPPISLEGIYSDRAVRLVDGGVYDNQGVETLLDQPCTMLFVSDAGAPMEPDANPREGVLDVVLRSIDVLQERIRADVYRRVEARVASGRLRGLMAVHLKTGLGPRADAELSRGTAAEESLTAAGINRRVQEKLAAIRTDLDAFADAEAYTLMCCGYLLAGDELRRQFPDLAGTAHEWKFLAARDGLTASGATPQRLLHQLDVARFRTYKSLRLAFHPRLPLGMLLKTTAITGLLWWAWQTRWSWRRVLGWFDNLALVVGVVVLIAAVAFAIRAAGRRQSGFLDQLLSVVLAIGGALVSRLQLHVFDKLYLRLGRLKR